MSWHLPIDAGWGGISILDGNLMDRYDGDMWGNWEIDFEASVPAGNHVLEVFGGEGCCDGTTSWNMNG